MPLPLTFTPRTALGRVKRSLVQMTVGFVPAIVIMTNDDHLSAYKAEKYAVTSFVGVLVITLMQNYAESKGWLRPRE